MNIKQSLICLLVGTILAGAGCDVYALDREKLKEQLKIHEGYSQNVYPDSKGIPTIGIGLNLMEGSASNRLHRVGADYNKVLAGRQYLNDSQITKLFNEDVDIAERTARKVIKSYDSQPEIVQRVVCDMIFNIGEPRFRGFKKTISAIESRDYDAAAREMQNSVWHSQVGDRSKKLVNDMKSAAPKAK